MTHIFDFLNEHFDSKIIIPDVKFIQYSTI